MPHTSRLAPSSSLSKAVWSPTWLIFLELHIFAKNGMNHFSLNVMGWCEFPDTLSLDILHLGGNISDGTLCVEDSLI
jgi:hypothetical protein